MNRFEVVSRYSPRDIPLPTRGTKFSAGYDLAAAQDVVIPGIFTIYSEAEAKTILASRSVLNFEEVKSALTRLRLKPFLVPTGIKVKLDSDCYLSLSTRSSLPLKSLLLMPNAPGIIDADYYNNPDNEGEIFIQLINLSPFAIRIQKGEKIAQGIIMRYLVAEGDTFENVERLGGHGSTD